MALRALHLFAVLSALTCALAADGGGRVRRQTFGGGLLSALGGLAEQVAPGGLLQQLQGAAGLFGQTTPAPQYTQYPQYPQYPQVGGGYGEYYPAAAPAPTSVRDALETLVRRDTRRCLPRLVCEAAAGALTPADALGAFRAFAPALGVAGRQEVLSGADALFGLFTLLGGAGGGGGAIGETAGDGALARLGRAALLGAASRGRPDTCLAAYPACPRDPARLLLYLNNHRGGVFRLFGGPPGPYDAFGYFRSSLHLQDGSEAAGRSLAATPSVALPAEHRAVRRVRRRAVNFPEREGEGEAEEGHNALDDDPSRILHPPYSKFLVRFPSDGDIASQIEKAIPTRMRFPRDFKDTGSRIVGATAGERPPRDEIVAEGYEHEADTYKQQRPYLGSSSAAQGSGSSGFFPEEYIITSGGNEYPLAPGQSPEDFDASHSGYPRPQPSGSSSNKYQRPSSHGSGSVYNGPYAPTVNELDNQRLHSSNGNVGKYQRPYVTNSNQPNYERPFGSTITFSDDPRPQDTTFTNSGGNKRPGSSVQGLRDTRKGRGGFKGRLRFPREGEDLGIQSGSTGAPPPAYRPVPMVFPDRTGTGELLLDNKNVYNRYPSTEDAKLFTKFSFPGRYSA